MATTGKKKVRGLWKREVKFIRDRLQGLDLEIMTAFVVSEVEAVEYHVAHYPERQALWTHLKSSKKQEKLMKFLRGTFFKLFYENCTSADVLVAFLLHGTK